MKDRGFTLIELLIVITIIAILAGAVLPYVQQYVEDSRLSKAKQDLDELRNAIIRYETDQDRIYPATDLSPLVGPYITQAKADPWGGSYIVSPASSTVYSVGPDRKDNSGDEITAYFRPPLAISRAYWQDSNKNTFPDTGDHLILKFTRPLRREAGDGPVTANADDDLVFSSGNLVADYTSLDFFNNNMTVKMGLDFTGATPFVTGRDTVTVTPNSNIVDGDGIPCRESIEAVIKPQ